MVIGTYLDIVHPIGSLFGWQSHNVLKTTLSKMKMIPPIGEEPTRKNGHILTSWAQQKNMSKFNPPP